MREILRIIKTEIRCILTTMPVLLVVSFAPIVYPFFYNYTYVNKCETKIPVTVVDQDGSALSRDLVRRLDATEQLTVSSLETGVADARQAIEKNGMQAVVIIPKGFEAALKKMERPSIRAYVNTTRFMIAVDIGKGLSEAIAAFGREKLVRAFEESGCSREQAACRAQPIIIRNEGVANAADTYGDYIIPALLLLILQQSLFAGTAVASAGRGRKRNPFPGAIGSEIVGRAVPYLALYGGYAALFFSFQYRLWHIPFNGNAAALAALVALHLITTVAAGFLVGALCRSRLTALLLTMFSSYPMFLLSGIAWPRNAMPTFLRIFSEAFPATHFFPAAMAASRLGGGWHETLPALGALAIISAVSLTLLTAILRSQKKKANRPLPV
jgi:ABC-2 type transport system permease protein